MTTPGLWNVRFRPDTMRDTSNGSFWPNVWGGNGLRQQMLDLIAMAAIDHIEQCA
jgi:hypothetical protein